MLQLVNNTNYAAERGALVNREGNQIWVVVIKATFQFSEDGEVRLHSDQENVCLAPRYADEPSRSSLIREAELVCEHLGTDVSLVGKAYAPAAKPAKEFDASIRVGAIAKTIRIFGKRVWQRGLWGLRTSETEPITEQLINYENAFGGTVPGMAADQTPSKEERNPIGMGYAISSKNLEGKPLPRIEDPNHLIKTWNTYPCPAGFGPIPAHWQPRKGYAGTFDADWKRQQMPLLPKDYDLRQSQSAHPDLVGAEPLQGGEPVELVNLSPRPVVRFTLPKPYFVLTTTAVDQKLRQNVQLDRVIIEPDAHKLVMVWRSTLNCGSRVRNIVKTEIAIKPWQALARSVRQG